MPPIPAPASQEPTLRLAYASGRGLLFDGAGRMHTGGAQSDLPSGDCAVEVDAAPRRHSRSLSGNDRRCPCRAPGGTAGWLPGVRWHGVAARRGPHGHAVRLPQGTGTGTTARPRLTRPCKHCGGVCPPYLSCGRPPRYCSPQCQRAADALRAHLKASGLWVPPPPPQRRVVGVLVIVTVEVGGVPYERVWHGAMEGHWSVVKGGLCV